MASPAGLPSTRGARPVRPSPSRPALLRHVFVALLLAAAGAATAQAQPVDTTATVVADSSHLRTPRGAVTRALLLPGLGQVYNRQYVKAPVVVAGVAGAVGYAIWRQRRYAFYRRAALFAGCEQDPDSTPERVALCTEVAPDYQDEWESLGEPGFSSIAQVRNTARGQRDIGFLAVGVAYAFQVLDAYVAAELASFDVSEDVTVTLDPSTSGVALAVRVRL